MMSAVDLERGAEDETSAGSRSDPRFGWAPSVRATPLGVGWDAEPLVLDWFGQGRPDLLVTAGGGPAGRSAWLFRPVEGSTEFPPVYDGGRPVEALDGLRCVCAIPNGAASRFDLVALDQNGLVRLPNEGDAERPSFGRREALGVPADLGLGPCRVVQMVAVDWDGDGLNDLLAGVDDLTDYWPDEGPVPPEQRVGFNQRGGHPGYDRNGLWRGRAPRGRLIWLRNVGRDGAPAFELQPEIGAGSAMLDLAPHPAALAVAWGGAGSLELMVTDLQGTVRVLRNFGGQRPPVLMEPRTLQCGHGPLLLPDDRIAVVEADLDGDRRSELVYGTSDGRVFAVHSGPSRNDARTPAPLLHEGQRLRLGGRAVLAVADLDADGDLDLVYGDATGRLHSIEDLGTGAEHRYAAPVPIEAGGAPFRVDPGPDGMLEGPAAPRLGYACPAIADWTGNGRPDLIVGGAGGEILLLRNDGAPNSPRFGAPVALRCEGAPLIGPPRVRPAVADWTGRGEPDLLALDLQGFLCLFPRTGKLDVGRPIPLVDRLGRFLRLDGGFGRAGRCAIWAGPWSGSGQTDLLVGLPRGNHHVIPALTGTPLQDADDLPTVLLLEHCGQGVVIPRPLRYQDGRPVVFGTDGCSPCGVDASGRGVLDLLVGSDDGRLDFIARDDLRW
jgi:hypothetical protein